MPWVEVWRLRVELKLFGLFAATGSLRRRLARRDEIRLLNPLLGLSIGAIAWLLGREFLTGRDGFDSEGRPDVGRLGDRFLPASKEGCVTCLTDGLETASRAALAAVGR